MDSAASAGRALAQQMTIVNRKGLHARASARFVRTAECFDAEVKVTIADRPEVTAQRVAVLRDLELVDLTPAIRVERSVRANSGAMIVSVTAQVAQDLGIQNGDVIIQVNTTPIRDARQLKQVLESMSGRDRVRMYLERRGQQFYTDFLIKP